MSVHPRARGSRGGRGTAAAALALAALALTGCSADGQSIDLVAPASAPVQESPAVPRSEPAWIEIPRIGARSSLVPLGLNPDRTIEVPSVHQPMQAGWYQYGPTPGETGPAVVLGHVNGDGQDGIFARLRELRPGDEILIGRQDGRVARFVVDRMAQPPKTGFPADEVYGDTAGPELRLITCGGSFDHSARSYRDNIIAFAALTGLVR
ncbi:Sortase family protein [Saccharopolyspora shandongensis]|uniref:Sortase family protein n=1 Tax=Saccharopolyspora shandongensis TaxID=418495 RepID=A0A1H3Q8P8_9PSEU|nr:class F sortase [Saccharopolyspora shandongensis]SDZ09643.1 Sortase family protein [Saccharopolyspora shandongensis]